MIRVRRLIALMRLGHRTTRAERLGTGPGVVLAMGACLLVATVLTSWGAWNVITARQARADARDIHTMGNFDRGVALTSRTVPVGDSELTIVAVGSVKGAAELPPGVDHFPIPGEMIVSPAVRNNPEVAAEGILPYRDVGLVDDEGLVSPVDLIAYVGMPDNSFRMAGRNELLRYNEIGRPIPNPLFKPVFVAFYDAFAVLIVLVGFGAVIRAAVRVSESLQSRRLDALRALGLTPVQLRLVAATRGLLWCTGGAGAAAALFIWAAPRITHVPFTDIFYFPSDVGVSWLTAIGVAAAVPIAAAAISAFPMETRVGRPPGRFSTVRTWFAPAALAVLAIITLLPPGPLTKYSWWVAVSAVFASVGVGTAGLIRIMGRRMGKSTPPTVRLAGRRLAVRASADSRLFTPLGALLLISLVAVPFGRITNIDYRQTWQRLLGDMGRRVVAVETTDRNLDLGGEHVLAAVPRLATYSPTGDDFYGGEILVVTCEQMKMLSVACPAEPGYVPFPDEKAVTVSVLSTDNHEYQQVEPLVPVDLSRHPIDQLPGMVVVTPDMLSGPLSSYEFAGYTVFLDTTPEAFADLQVQVAGQQPTARVVSVIDNEIAHSTILLPISAGSALATTLLAVFVVLAIGIAMMNQGIEANRLHAPLKMMGAPSRFTLGSYLWEILPPAVLVASISILAAVLVLRSLTVVWGAPITSAGTVAVYSAATYAAILAVAVGGAWFTRLPLQPEILNTE